MRKSFYYILGLFCLMFALTACEGREPDLFDKDSNGAYFDYDYANEFEHTLNFSDHIADNPDTVSVTLKVKLLGYLMDEARTLSVKTKPVEGHSLAGVAIEKVVFANKEYEKQIEVKVKRPEFEDTVYAVCIYLDGSGDIGSGIVGKNEINLYVKESYEKPEIWYSHMDNLLGTWNKKKHIFLAQHKGDSHFYSNFYESLNQQHNYDSILALNVSAVNALLAVEPEEGIELVDLPIIKESDHPAYTEPYFWSEYEETLGLFRANKFCRFVGMLGGATTNNIAALFASKEAKTKMDNEAENFHKDDFLYMLNEYYSYAKLGYPISEYKNLCWVKMGGANYKVRIPYWWEDPDALGTGEIVKKYFGEYNDEKYKFMLQTMLAEDGADNFITESILPFVYDKENETYAWDNSPFGEKQLSGEERLKECYRRIKDVNDNDLPPSRRHDIPDVVLD